MSRAARLSEQNSHTERLVVPPLSSKNTSLFTYFLSSHHPFFFSILPSPPLIFPSLTSPPSLSSSLPSPGRSSPLLSSILEGTLLQEITRAGREHQRWDGGFELILRTHHVSALCFSHFLFSHPCFHYYVIHSFIHKIIDSLILSFIHSFIHPSTVPLQVFCCFFHFLISLHFYSWLQYFNKIKHSDLCG